jgi:hypothetical protein
VVDTVLSQTSWFDIAVDEHDIYSLAGELLGSIQTSWTSPNDCDKVIVLRFCFQTNPSFVGMVSIDCD